MTGTPSTHADRRATAGRCTCGTRVVRGPDQDGHLATVDIHPVDAAAELTAHDAGHAIYVMSWHGGMVLDRRTVTDLAHAPAGFTPDRVVVAHTCPRKDTTP